MTIVEIVRHKAAGRPDDLHVVIHDHGQPRPPITACGLPRKGMSRSSDPQGQMDRLVCPGCIGAIES